MRTATYARESKDDNGEAENVEIQLDEGRDYAAEMGWQVVEVFQDNDISASGDKHRPGYEALKASIQAGEIDCILVTEMSRLNRKLWHSIDLFRLAETTPLQRIATTDGGGYDLSTKQGIHNAITAAIEAERESMRLAERVQRKKARQARDGEYGGGPRPFGYDYRPARREGARVVEPGRLVVNQAEAAVVRDAAAWLLEGRSLRGVVIELNQAGRLRAEGRVWWPSTLRDVLTSPRIAGIRSHKGELYPAAWRAILDADTFDRLQLVLKAEARFAGADRKGARSYLLTGMVDCGRCGAPLVGYGNRDHGTVMRRRYYCLRTDNRGVVRGCGKVSRLAEPVDALVTEAVLDVLDSPRMAEVLGAATADGEMATLVETYRGHKLRLDDLVTDYASGLLDRQQLARAKRIVEAAMETTRRRLDKLASSRALAAVPVGRSLREAWAAADLDWRRQLLALVVERVVLHPTGPGGRPWPEPGSELAERIEGRWRFDPAAVEIRWRV